MPDLVFPNDPQTGEPNPVVPPATPVPLPGTGNATTNVPLPPAPELDSSDDDAMVASLTPGAVLGTKPSLPPTPPAPAPTTPATPKTPMPATGSPLDDDPDTDTLIRQAANAPAQPLILPNRRQTEVDAEERLKPGPGAKQQFTTPPTAKDLSDIAVETRPTEELKGLGAATTAEMPGAKPTQSFKAGEMLVAPRPPQAPGGPMAPRPVASLVPPPAPPVVGKAPGIPLAPASTRVPGRGVSGAVVGIGLIILIILLGGGMAVLSLSGVRIPVISKLLSGVEASAPGIAKQAAAFVDAQKAYHVSSTTTVSLAQGVVSQVVPADGSTPVSTLKVSSDDTVVTDKGTRYMGVFNVSANSGAAVPVYLRASGTSLVTMFPTNTSKTAATLGNTDLADTLFAPVVQPLALEDILPAVGAETAYRKVTVNGSPAAEYTLTLDPSKFTSYMPGGVTPDSVTAVIALAWKGGANQASEPLDSTVTASFTYKALKYTVTFSSQYEKWGDVTPASQLTDLAKLDPKGIIEKLNPAQFSARLGISYLSIPHGGSDYSGGGTTGTPFSAITPSGETISAVQTARGTTPPKPTQPATAQAKTRDTQRKQDLADLKKAIDQYKLDTGSYPSVTTETQLGSDSTLFSLLVPKYLTKMPVDPLNSTYYYAYNVTRDGSGTISGYILRSILEDNSDTAGKSGAVYYYYQVTN